MKSKVRSLNGLLFAAHIILCAGLLTGCGFSSITISTEPPTADVPESSTFSENVQVSDPVHKQTPKPTLIPLEIPEDYPEMPEGVVLAFLKSYQADPAMMPLYLSSAIRRDLPEGGIVEMIGFEGELEGFSIESAAVQMDPPFALIGVQVQDSGKISYRGFNLTQEQERWVIQSVSFSIHSN